MKGIFLKKYIIFALVVIIILTFDYFNLLSYIGIKTDNFNLDFINLIVIISIFIFTYSFLDMRKIEKEKNKNDISRLIMLNTYKECLENINIVTDEIMNKYIVPNTDFDKLKPDKNDRISNIQKHPFINQAMLYPLLNEGQININNFKKYIEIQRGYEKYFTLRITFYDVPEIYNPVKKEILEMIKNEINKLEGDFTKKI